MYLLHCATKSITKAASVENLNISRLQSFVSCLNRIALSLLFYFVMVKWMLLLLSHAIGNKIMLRKVVETVERFLDLSQRVVRNYIMWLIKSNLMERRRMFAYLH